MTEHFTREEAAALAKAAGFEVRRGLGLRESVPEDVFARGLINEEVTALCNAAVTAKLKEWDQGAVAIELPDYHEAAMGCGLEDRDITDRYEAMRHGWDCAMDRVFEQIPDEPLYTHALPAQPAEPAKDVSVLVETLGETGEAAAALRAEIAAIRATQEPVAYWVPKAEQFCIADKSGRPFAKAWEPLYASPVSKDAGLVAVQQWRFNGASDWYDGHPDLTNGGGPYEVRVLYARPKLGGV